MYILGLSAYYHDSAAALLKDDLILSAVQEERFTRKKHDPDFPRLAIKFCLENARINLDDIDYIVFYEKPILKFDRLLETYLAFAPKGFKSFLTSMPIWIKEKLFQKNLLIDELMQFQKVKNLKEKILFCEHHQSHAASAFYPSPFREALVLTMDGVGEWTTASTSIGKGSDLSIVKEMFFPHSLGLLYSAFTYYLGFKVNSGEYKVMGLAPYGKPKYSQLILDNLLDLKKDGSFRLNYRYFNYCTGFTMTNDRFHELFGGPPRNANQALTPRHMDLAASIQAVTEEVMLRITHALYLETKMENLCLAGGVALNCVANGKILKAGHFKNIWIQPAAGDSGGALGAAFYALYNHTAFNRQPSKPDNMQGSYLGPAFSQSEIHSRLSHLSARFQVLADCELIKKTAKFLAKGKIVGWFQGRMEFGPRALGSRSILADPRNKTMQKSLNLKIKYRESFRPFAPSILEEEISNWFDISLNSPYMLLVAEISQKHKNTTLSPLEEQLFGLDRLNLIRSSIPAVTHIDYSARIQTVSKDVNPLYHALLNEFKRLTGCPILVNTSFNIRGEPIVLSPEDAFHCFMGTEIDVLVIGNCILRKEDQDSSLKKNYQANFELD